MIFAHGPAGYLLGRAAKRAAPAAPMWAAIAGAYAPDADVPYFAFFGPEVADHHYWSPLHWPLFWLALGLPLTIWAWRRGPGTLIAVATFLAGVLSHLCLDTVTWYIYWGAPFTMEGFKLTDPTGVHRPWPWNFLSHWTMGLEALIALAALWVRLAGGGRLLPALPRRLRIGGMGAA